jgi:signal transduction histidine kinase
MSENNKVNILLVDDQPAKLLTYEAILSDLGENLIKANSGTEALKHLLKTDVAVVLVDVSMPELDGFELAEIIRQHPRYQKTAIIFVSAVHLTDLDRLKGYEHGAVDYVSVPIIPELLRAKVSVFAELYRKTQQLEWLNHELEQRVAERTAELEALNAELEQRVIRRTSELQAAYKKLEEEAAGRERVAAERNELQRRLMESRETERLHLAQELHDGPMQELHAITFHLAALQNSLCDEIGQAQLAAGQAALHQVLQSLRMTATELRPSTLIPFGLASAIRSHAEEFQKRYSELKVVLDLELVEPLLLERMRLALFRIYQHALVNTAKYAQAQQVTVRLSESPEQIHLEIEDDGCGFEMPAHWIDLARQGHLGLVGMTERAEAIGGQMRVISAPGKGTLIHVSVPYAVQPAAIPAMEN